MNLGRNELNVPEDTLSLYIDGCCVMCSGIARFVAHRSPEGSVEFHALQDVDMQGNEADTVVAEAGGHSYLRSEAVVQVLLRMQSPWPLVGRLLSAVPVSLRDLLYRAVAACRYRVFGRSEACTVPGN